MKVYHLLFTLTEGDGDGIPNSLGDALWLVEGPSFNGAPKFVGLVDRISGNTITFNQPGEVENAPAPQLPLDGDFIFYVKDNRQDKSGVIGYYSKVTMTNTDTEKAEIFAVNSESFIQTS